MDIGDNEDFHSGRGIKTLEGRVIESNGSDGAVGGWSCPLFA